MRECTRQNLTLLKRLFRLTRKQTRLVGAAAAVVSYRTRGTIESVWQMTRRRKEKKSRVQGFLPDVGRMEKGSLHRTSKDTRKSEVSWKEWVLSARAEQHHREP